MSRRTSNRSGSTVDNEVANLFKLQNKNQFANAIAGLRQRYKDEELVNKIQELFVSRHSGIVKSAKKFAAAVKAKYAAQNVPFHFLLLKARAHAKKHNLTEAEFAEFQRIYEQELAGNGSMEVVIPETNLMKVLGTVSNGTDNHFNVNDDDYRNLQEIIKLNDTSKNLHSQVILQSLLYTSIVDKTITDAGAELRIVPEMASAEYDSKFMNPVQFIHPVIAALFVPKIEVIESHFLYSNIAGIVKARYNRTPILNKADYELFYNLVTDPNDIVCDMRTPVGDLLHRCNLQNHLWNMVLHLRNGQIYTPATQDFITAVDVCRLNKNDNPELLYGRHDGTIIKRLFSAFSFRPTTVSTSPVTVGYAFNPYSMVVRPTVGNIPMINIRASTMTIPKISEALKIDQQYIEGNIMTNRLTQVMYSREIMVFYIDRRLVNVLQGRTTFNLLSLPKTVAGVERINLQPLEVERELRIGGTSPDDKFDLISAVCYKTQKAELISEGDHNDFAVGSFTYFLNPSALNNRDTTDFVRYDPQARQNFPFHRAPEDRVVTPAVVDPTTGVTTPAKIAAIEKIQTCASVLIYKNVKSKGDMPSFWA